MQIRNDFDLSEVLWYKVGGKAKYFIEADSKEDILQALSFVEKMHPHKLFICGLGSNLIFSDEYFDGAVIQIRSNPQLARNIVKVNDGLVECFAGEELESLIQFSFQNNLIGLEWAGGLPGTVGAGVRGNVGAFGSEIKDNFAEAEIIEINGSSFNTYTKGADEFHFSYRNSLVKENKNMIVISAKFALQAADPGQVASAQSIYNQNITYRKIHHPIEYPNCGSVFKNIADKNQVDAVIAKWPDIKETVNLKWHGKVSMGYIIKRLGLLGYTVGKMQISSKHCNFIINLGGGKASDVRSIIKEIQNKVSAEFGFVPEVEVEIVS